MIIYIILQNNMADIFDSLIIVQNDKVIADYTGQYGYEYKQNENRLTITFTTQPVKYQLDDINNNNCPTNDCIVYFLLLKEDILTMAFEGTSMEDNVQSNKQIILSKSAAAIQYVYKPENFKENNEAVCNQIKIINDFLTKLKPQQTQQPDCKTENNEIIQTYFLNIITLIKQFKFLVHSIIYNSVIIKLITLKNPPSNYIESESTTYEISDIQDCVKHIIKFNTENIVIPAQPNSINPVSLTPSINNTFELLNFLNTIQQVLEGYSNIKIPEVIKYLDILSTFVIKYIVEYTTKLNDLYHISGSETQKKNINDFISLLKKPENLDIIDKTYINESNSRLITYIKINNTESQDVINKLDIKANKQGGKPTLGYTYNSRFNISIKDNTALRVQYNADNIPYYNDTELDQHSTEYDTNEDLKKYKYSYIYGHFSKIFTPEQTNKTIALDMKEVIQSLTQEKPKPVFIIGYGSSGAGKTSSLIYFNKGDGEQKDGVLIWLLKKLCSQKDGYNKVKFYTREFSIPDKANVLKAKHNVRTPNDGNYIVYKWDNDKFVLDETNWDTIKEELTGDKRHNKYRTTEKIMKSSLSIYRKNIEQTAEYEPNLTETKDIGEVLIQLIDTNRFVKATTNNPNSSRSHVVVYITLESSNGSKTANLYIGDFAGVENQFKCDDLATVQGFLNVERDNEKDTEGKPMQKRTKFYNREFYYLNDDTSKPPTFDLTDDTQFGGVPEKYVKEGFDATFGLDDEYVKAKIEELDSNLSGGGKPGVKPFNTGKNYRQIPKSNSDNIDESRSLSKAARNELLATKKILGDNLKAKQAEEEAKQTEEAKQAEEARVAAEKEADINRKLSNISAGNMFKILYQEKYQQFIQDCVTEKEFKLKTYVLDVSYSEIEFLHSFYNIDGSVKNKFKQNGNLLEFDTLVNKVNNDVNNNLKPTNITNILLYRSNNNTQILTNQDVSISNIKTTLSTNDNIFIYKLTSNNITIFENSKTYKINQLVFINDVIYKCKKNNTSKQSINNTEFWEKYEVPGIDSVNTPFPIEACKTEKNINYSNKLSTKTKSAFNLTTTADTIIKAINKKIIINENTKFIYDTIDVGNFSIITNKQASTPTFNTSGVICDINGREFVHKVGTDYIHTSSCTVNVTYSAKIENTIVSIVMVRPFIDKSFLDVEVNVYVKVDSDYIDVLNNIQILGFSETKKKWNQISTTKDKITAYFDKINEYLTEISRIYKILGLDFKTKIENTDKFNADVYKNITDEMKRVLQIEPTVTSPNFKKLVAAVKDKYGYGKIACENRLNEGIYINDSLSKIRETISEIMKTKTSAEQLVVPHFIDDCYESYCPNGDYCFQSNDTKQPNTDSIPSEIFQSIFDDIKATQTDYSISTFYTEILVCLYCVFNIARATNNPPKSRYIDVNELKYFLLSDGRTFNHTESPPTDGKGVMQNFSKIIERLSANYFNGITGTEQQKAYDIDGLLYIGDNKTYIKDLFILIRDNEVHDAINRINKIIIENKIIERFDTYNAASTIGTLEYADHFAKMNLVNNVCTTYNFLNQDETKNVSNTDKYTPLNHGQFYINPLKSET